MENTLLFTQSVKTLLLMIKNKYNIDIENIKNKFRNNIETNKKKLIKIEYLWEFIWNDEEYRKILINELIVIPIYIPQKNDNYVIINPKKINNYLSQFTILLDIDVKEVISNILYLFINYMFYTYPHNQISSIIEQYIINLIGIDKCLKKDYITLQEIILRSIFVEIVSQGYNKFTYANFESFFENICNPVLKEIIDIALENYKNIILNSC
jgi:hypothetical protein